MIYFELENEHKNGFTLVKKQKDKILGRFVYDRVEGLKIANATMCKSNRLSDDVTTIKVNNFFTQDLEVDVDFEYSYHKELVDFALYGRSSYWYTVNVRKYVFEFERYEILAKAELLSKVIRLLGSPTRYIGEGKNPREILKLTKTGIKILKEYGVLTSYEKDNNFLSYYLKEVENTIAKDQREDYFEKTMIAQVKLLIKKYNYKLPTLLNYIGNVCPFTQGLTTPLEVASLLVDTNKMYEDMEEKLGDKYSKSLKKEHDLVMYRHNITIKDIERVRFERTRKENIHLETVIDDYKFIYPETLEQIKEEGKKLRHCVGSYCSRVAEGYTNIIFMRLKDSPSKNLITLEIRDEEVIQARGMSNRCLNDIENEILNKYKKFLKNVDKNKNR